MDIFKFGGASLQNPAAIEQMSQLLAEYEGNSLVVVVSAMGKVTQKLEEIFHKYLHNHAYESSIKEVYLFHLDIVQVLLGNTCLPLQAELDAWKQQVIKDLKTTYLPENIEKLYSKIVAWGEILSSRIIYYYLLHLGMPCRWVDARKYIKTRCGFMNAQLDEARTRVLIRSDLMPFLAQNQFLLTQGFIGSDLAGITTTLGKEGSDFTGAILAAALEATSLTIWKDVPGIMNADPKVFEDLVQFEELSYEIMAKMSFYGAQVVHPKTIYPLAMQGIPLHIRPFHDRHAKGTVVHNTTKTVMDIPIYILRKDQLYIKLRIGDFIFLEEKQLAMVFTTLDKLSLHINLLERTPYSLSICLNKDCIQVAKLLSLLETIFKVDTYASVCLLTVMGQNQEAALKFLKAKTILAKQHDQSVCQVVFS